MKSRSNSAIAPNTVKMNRPVFVVDSMFSFCDINSMPRSCKFSTNNNKSFVFLANLEMLSTTTVSPSRAKASISFNAGSAGKLTLVLGDASAAIKVDGTKYSANNGIVTVDLSAGEHTITKGDSTNLFYMVFGGSAGTNTTPQQPAQTTVTTTKNNTSSSTTVVNPPASSSSGIDKIVDDAIYCSPNGTGSGTKDSPTDVLSAIKNIKAGGTIYLLDGTYKYDSTIIIDSFFKNIK